MAKSSSYETIRHINTKRQFFCHLRRADTQSGPPTRYLSSYVIELNGEKDRPKTECHAVLNEHSNGCKFRNFVKCFAAFIRFNNIKNVPEFFHPYIDGISTSFTFYFNFIHTF
ncbi:hypothetical protein CDAR_68781 [Caerostris darwini]|uniref:Uncharacterized protein n=1 Tax=Caerostris darwini TaxID=1538125 RepID=A0AAV4WZN0_9ARAC|nr:hypothetical protein CDAR_68781 [Caerostris darwini]